jgi:preprotein translocase subunit SecG
MDFYYAVGKVVTKPITNFSLKTIYYGVGDFFINLVKKFSHTQPSTGAGAAAGVGGTSGKIASRIPFGWFNYDLQVALVWFVIALIVFAIFVTLRSKGKYDERREKSFEKNRKALQHDHNRPR